MPVGVRKSRRRPQTQGRFVECSDISGASCFGTRATRGCVPFADISSITLFFVSERIQNRSDDVPGTPVTFCTLAQPVRNAREAFLRKVNSRLACSLLGEQATRRQPYARSFQKFLALLFPATHRTPAHIREFWVGICWRMGRSRSRLLHDPFCIVCQWKRPGLRSMPKARFRLP